MGQPPIPTPNKRVRVRNLSNQIEIGVGIDPVEEKALLRSWADELWSVNVTAACSFEAACNYF